MVTMRSITISIDGDNPEIDAGWDRSLARFEVQYPDGTLVRDPGHRVLIYMTREAMLSMAVELIRSAQGEPFMHHYDPLSPGSTVEFLGVFLHPESCSVIFSMVESTETVRGLVASLPPIPEK